MNKVSIYGGLGNQMFQYALFIALKKNKRKVRISFSSFFYEHNNDGFVLAKAFKLRLNFLLNIQFFILQNRQLLYKNKIVAFFLKRAIPWYENKFYKTYYEKKPFEYDPDIFMQKSSLFVGIWQVESYFKEAREILLEEFVFKIPGDQKNKALTESITNSNSVSMHIRRGDYLNSHYATTHSVINGPTYYINAADYLGKKIQNPHYYIFSDDMNWVKENIKLANCTYVTNNSGENSYADMYLMSLCKHNIIANSTFSWWGAWLNKNENKIVIMPERWLNNDKTLGIFPSEWIKFTV